MSVCVPDYVISSRKRENIVYHFVWFWLHAHTYTRERTSHTYGCMRTSMAPAYPNACTNVRGIGYIEKKTPCTLR
eukprot:NODE_2100_length_766_cov_62.521618_g1689_i0.p4 GENE.NODE_2100_length_766_cov_62.521618_g1689_i0~~NODE_2100_length_766_cov_62.521618_g1689_i0.p4  ORF type:complete len:75 (-),score=7.83 NODE_2100_length_766_cov_62.521618_g1689_i0:4-228(-)